MKPDFNNLNIEPMPNPKPLSVERVSVRMEHTDDNGKTTYGPVESGYVRNANLHPAAHTGKG